MHNRSSRLPPCGSNITPPEKDSPLESSTVTAWESPLIAADVSKDPVDNRDKDTPPCTSGPSPCQAPRQSSESTNSFPPRIYKRHRGRPRKMPQVDLVDCPHMQDPPVKRRRRGRPRKGPPKYRQLLRQPNKPVRLA